FFQAEDGIRDFHVTGVQTCALPICPDVLLEPLSSFSFPSGHSSAAFAFFLTLGVLAGREQPPRMRLTWLLLACLPATAIALSRVYLGVHWPSDVLAGAMLAARSEER